MEQPQKQIGDDMTDNPPSRGPAPAYADLVDAICKGLAHNVPEDCWATGPSTGNEYEDLVVCPGCRALEALNVAGQISAQKDARIAELELDQAVKAVAREGRHARRIEIERLRAALEFYAAEGSWRGTTNDAHDDRGAIARNALAGSSGAGDKTE